MARGVERPVTRSLLVSDHGPSQLPSFPAVEAAADATGTPRVGAIVLNADRRDPVLVARGAATVDPPSMAGRSWGWCWVDAARLR
jgi:alkanesulfonate monooxygenase SsuD/methylene tetrahydromethanopterin reductase-like flavin-dependent oxidoreductase (luciferase family)